MLYALLSFASPLIFLVVSLFIICIFVPKGKEGGDGQ